MIERLLEAERDLVVGLVDRAEAIYRSLLETDPQNAVAVVGLARCALERGDDRSAYTLAVRALAIDPENAAALRLEARLSEILAARGQPVVRPASVLPDAARATPAQVPEVARPGEGRGEKPGLLRRILGRR
jgi:thioredoxin-like negative regulator of GroEL